MPSAERLPDYRSLVTEETKEKLPLSGRVVLVTGATSGIGYYMAHLTHELGADVVIGTRSLASYEKMAEEFGEERVFPFIADVTKTDQVQEAFDWLVHLNKIPTDIVLCAAGGLEELLDPTKGLVLPSARLRGKKGERREESIKDLKEKFRLEVENTMEYSEAINSSAQIDLIKKWSEIKSDKPRRVIFESSLWSSIYGNKLVKTPEFYKGIASSKRKFEQWVDENSERLAELGIHIGKLSGNIVIDSNIGQFVDTILWPLLTDEEKDIVNMSYTTREDMVLETADMLMCDPKKWRKKSLSRYLVGSGQKAKDYLSPETPIFSVDFLL